MNTQDAAVAQSVVRRIGSAEVTGPIPVASFLYRVRYVYPFITRK